MFARRGLIGCPCSVPVSLTSSFPSSMTPTRMHFQIRRSTLPSVTRFSIISTSMAQSLVLPPSGPKPVRATEKILLVDGVQQIHHHLLHELILEGRNRDWSLFPILFGNIHSAEWLNLILAFFEPLMELPDVLLGVEDLFFCGAHYKRSPM